MVVLLDRAAFHEDDISMKLSAIISLVRTHLSIIGWGFVAAFIISICDVIFVITATSANALSWYINVFFANSLIKR